MKKMETAKPAEYGHKQDTLRRLLKVDLTLPHIEISGKNLQQHLADGETVVALVQSGDDLFRPCISSDEKPKGWYILETSAQLEELQRQFKDYYLQFFVMIGSDTITSLVDEKAWKYYLWVRKIADTFFRYVCDEDAPYSEGPSLEDRRDETVNPFHCQTEEGIYLEWYYSIPGSLYTPWGDWNCFGGGSNSDDGLLKHVLQHIKLREVEPRSNSIAGTFGPIYAVLAIDGEVLPEPTKRDEKTYIPYKQALSTWQVLTRQYLEETIVKGDRFKVRRYAQEAKELAGKVLTFQHMGHEFDHGIFQVQGERWTIDIEIGHLKKLAEAHKPKRNILARIFG